MAEVMLKTHLYVADVHEEYHIDWCGSIADAKPMFKNDMPIFVLISSDTRVEMNTIDMKAIEERAKRITHPRGRKAVTTDITRIYILEENGHQKLLGKVTHNHIKEYRQMYDPFERI